jgi:hypothetical protein
MSAINELDRLEECAKAVSAQKQRHMTVNCETILRLVRVVRAAKALVIRNQCDSLAHAMLCDDVYPLLEDMESAVLGLGKP